MGPKKTGKITLADVAAACNVSKATASYVLRGKKGGCSISSKTAERILAAAVELGYQPDAAAVALAALRRNPLRLLLLSPWLYAQYSDFMVRVNGVLEAAENVTVQYGNYRCGALKDILTPALCRKADAVLVVGTWANDEAFLRRNRAKFANVMLLNRHIEDYPCVFGNDYDATCQLLRSVQNSGRYQHCAILHTPDPSSCERARISACQDVFPHAALSPLEGDPEDIFRALPHKDRLLLFIPQYQSAARMLLVAKRTDVAIPDRLGIVAYDNHSLLSDYVPIPLTTVDPCTEEMTRAAIRLAQSIRCGERPDSIEVKARLMIGSSVHIALL